MTLKRNSSEITEDVNNIISNNDEGLKLKLQKMKQELNSNGNNNNIVQPGTDLNKALDFSRYKSNFIIQNSTTGGNQPNCMNNIKDINNIGIGNGNGPHANGMQNLFGINSMAYNQFTMPNQRQLIQPQQQASKNLNQKFINQNSTENQRHNQQQQQQQQFLLQQNILQQQALMAGAALNYKQQQRGNNFILGFQNTHGGEPIICNNISDSNNGIVNSSSLGARNVNYKNLSQLQQQGDLQSMVQQPRMLEGILQQQSHQQIDNNGSLQQLRAQQAMNRYMLNNFNPDPNQQLQQLNFLQNQQAQFKLPKFQNNAGLQVQSLYDEEQQIEHKLQENKMKEELSARIKGHMLKYGKQKGASMFIIELIGKRYVTADDMRQNQVLFSRHIRDKASKKSEYKGVVWQNNDVKPYVASIIQDEKLHHVGFFKEEKEAALAYDAYARQIGFKDEQLNFPEIPSPKNEDGTSKHITLPISISLHKGEAVTLVPVSKSLKYRGVCWNKCNRSWKVSIKSNGKNTHIGYFSNRHEAAFAYDLEAVELRGSSANFNFEHVRVIKKENFV